MWWNPILFDFLPCPNSLVVGLSQLNPAHYKDLYDCRRELNTHVCAYMLVAEKPSILIQNLLHTMNHSGVLICSLQTTFLEMTFGVTEFQRYFLEVLGLIDFLEIYEPRMQGRAPRATSAADCHGAFTNNPQFAQQLFDASLSLYLIRTHKLVEANNPKLLNFVSYFMPTDLVHTEVDLPFPTIFEGSTMDHKKHASIHNYFQTWLVYGDPFGNKKNTLDHYIISKLDVYAASMTTPMSELLRPRPPV